MHEEHNEIAPLNDAQLTRIKAETALRPLR